MNHSLRNILFAAAFAVVGPAHATFFSNSTGLATFDQLIDFESVVLTPNEVVDDQFGSLGVTFEGAFANPDLSGATYPNISGNRIGNFQWGQGQSGLFTMNFSRHLKDVAFSLVSEPVTTTFEVFLNGALVASATAATSPNLTTNYFGFQGLEFDQLTITNNSSNPVHMIDNLQTTAVPEPASVAMLSFGLVLLGAAARRNNRRTNA